MHFVCDGDHCSKGAQETQRKKERYMTSKFIFLIIHIVFFLEQWLSHQQHLPNMWQWRRTWRMSYINYSHGEKATLHLNRH